MTNPITYTRPYPGGFRNRPDTSTPLNARAAQALDDGIAQLTAAHNALAALVAAGGGGGGGTGGGTVTDDGTTWTATGWTDDGTTWTGATISDDGTTWTA